MNQIVTPDDVKQLGTILGIWAHPDDETYSSAGIMAAAVQNGQRVACVTATKGEAGVRDESRWPAEKLADIRARELRAALDVLGVEEHHWLGCRDGDCRNMAIDEMTSRLSDIIKRVRPDTILTFGPEGLTGHPDHQTVSIWSTAAAAQSGLAPTIYQVVELRGDYQSYLRAADKELDIYFNIDEPPLADPADCDIYLCMTPELQATKRDALAAMPSQTEGMIQYFGEELLMQVFGCESFIRAN